MSRCLLLCVVSLCCLAKGPGSAFLLWEGHPDRAGSQQGAVAAALAGTTRSPRIVCDPLPQPGRRSGAASVGFNGGTGATVFRRASDVDADFTVDELAKGMKLLGFQLPSADMSKEDVLLMLAKVRFPVAKLESVLRKMRSKANPPSDDSAASGPAKKKRVNPEGDSPARGLEGFSPAQLRRVLNMIGIASTGSWPDRELVQKLRTMQISAERAAGMLHADDKKRAKDERTKERRGWQWQQAQESVADPQQREDAHTHGSFPGRGRVPSGGGQRSSRRSRRESWTEEDEEDVMDFINGEEWRASDEDYKRARSEKERFAKESHQQASHREHPVSRLTPDEAMLQAIREGWLERTLSRRQASQLLGVPSRPTSEELRTARRLHLQRWHPDRNQHDPNAAAAFRLVAVAVDALT